MEQTSTLDRSASSSKTLREIADLPGPRGLPLLGNLTQIDRTRVHASIEQWGHEFGPFFRFSLGRRHFLVVSDHEAIGSLLRDRPDGYRRTTRLSEIWNEDLARNFTIFVFFSMLAYSAQDLILEPYAGQRGRAVRLLLPIREYGFHGEGHLGAHRMAHERLNAVLCDLHPAFVGVAKRLGPYVERAIAAGLRQN